MTDSPATRPAFATPRPLRGQPHPRRVEHYEACLSCQANAQALAGQPVAVASVTEPWDRSVVTA